MSIDKIEVKNWKDVCAVFEDDKIIPKKIVSNKKKEGKLESLTIEVEKNE